MFARVREKVGLATLLSAMLLPTCSHDREDALAEVGRIEQACRDGDPTQARDLMLKAAKANREFERAFSRSGGNVGDPSRINACGLVLTQIRRNLKRR